MSPLPILVVVRHIHKVLKELSLEDIPRAMQPCLSQLRWQCLKLFHIVRLTLHQCHIILNKGLDEHIVFRDLSVFVSLFNENTLDVLVTLTTGVAGVVDSLGEVINTTQTRSNGLHLILRELCGLIQEDNVILNTL